ncbi:LysR family transcriptional regulator [Streptomyces huasconensis]|uniref:LysR family transcriptional regulator n=1 Tax=Streptomyces huasconensis TaxID=1854574 RepID=A0ABV3LSW1_9ACTN
MDLEIRHLRAVTAIADVGNLYKAARVLGVAQPTLTAQLRRIESSLGGPRCGPRPELSGTHNCVSAPHPRTRWPGGCGY